MGRQSRIKRERSQQRRQEYFEKVLTGFDPAESDADVSLPVVSVQSAVAAAALSICALVSLPLGLSGPFEMIRPYGYAGVFAFTAYQWFRLRRRYGVASKPAVLLYLCIGLWAALYPVLF